MNRLDRRLIAAMLAGLLLMTLTACAGRPDLQELHARIVPNVPLETSADAELRVSLEGRLADGRMDTIAESRYANPGPGPLDVVLRYDARAVERASEYELRAEVRDAGRVTHANSEPVTLTGAQAGSRTFEIPLESRVRAE